MKTIAEQIVSLEDTRKELEKRLGEVLQKSQDENRTTNSAESAEFDTVEDQIKTIDGDLARLRRMERIQAAGAQAAAVISEIKANVVSTGEGRSYSDVVLKTKENLEPGQLAARYIMCLGVAPE